MADTIAVITPDESLSVAVSEGVLTLSSTNLAAPAVVESMSNIADVDITTNGKVNGSILVYKTTTNKWTSSTTLDAQNMEGGEF
mgnify:FL=1|jgi:hypothetical protein